MLNQDVSGLSPYSNKKVSVICDYCGEEYWKRFGHYTNSPKEFVSKDACKHCLKAKQNEILYTKQEQGLLNRDDLGYWMFLENRLKEANLYLEQYQTFDNMRDNDSKLYSSIYKFDGGIFKFVEDNFDNRENLLSTLPTHYYRDKDRLTSVINSFIEKHNRFPLLKEMVRDLGIQERIINYHGGIYEIKREMGFVGESDLVDDSGYYNLSYCEYVTAQYLLSNKIPYKREQHPFPNDTKRSDFTLYKNGNPFYHVEVWGYSKSDSGKQATTYNEKRKEKEELYEKYNLNLISVEYDKLYRKSVYEIGEYLNDVFSNINDMEFDKVFPSIFVPSNQLSDEAILETIMFFSDDDNYLPKQQYLEENDFGYLTREIRKRHGSYKKFGEKFNKLIYGQTYSWDDDLVYEKFKYLVLDKNLSITTTSLKSVKGLSGLPNYYKSLNKTLMEYKINFYYLFINEIKTIHPEDLKYLQNIHTGNTLRKTTSIQKEKVKYILNQYEKIVS